MSVIMTPKKHKVPVLLQPLLTPLWQLLLRVRRQLPQLINKMCLNHWTNMLNRQHAQHAQPSNNENSAPKTQPADPPISTDSTQVDAVREFIPLIVLSNPVSIRDITSQSKSIVENGFKIHGNCKDPKTLLNSRSDHSAVPTWTPTWTPMLITTTRSALRLNAKKELGFLRITRIIRTKRNPRGLQVIYWYQNSEAI